MSGGAAPCATATPEILARIARARELTRAYAASDYRDRAGRARILRALLGGLGENVAIDTPFHCDHGCNIFLGSNVVIGMNCTFVDNARITVGSNVLIASNVQIYTATHPVDPAARLDPGWEAKGTTWFRTCAAPVTIGDGAWIGGGAIVLPGVEIGANAVVGAGSVVTRAVPPACVAAGNPCRVIRRVG